MYTVTLDLRTFSAAHRLNKGYQGKCKYLHGHSYNVRVTLQSATLNEYDFVIDFGDIKQLFDRWVQENWDHVTLVSEKDQSLLAFLESDNQVFYQIPGGQNTTSEVLAEHLFKIFNERLSAQQAHYPGVALTRVRVSESAHSHADYVA